jgi:hypothetical protein
MTITERDEAQRFREFRFHFSEAKRTLSDNLFPLQKEAKSMSIGALGGVTFTAADRCDQCGAQAHVETRTHTQGMGSSGLMWCAQHFAELQMKLLAGGARVVRDSRNS